MINQPSPQEEKSSFQYPPSSPAMQHYFQMLEQEVERARTVATKARQLGYDPEQQVDIPLARTMAERVEGLISIVAPQLVGSGMTKRIEELEEEYGALDWRVALKIAAEVAQEKFCSFKDKREAIEVGIRVGMAYNTAGIVAAPLEGFIEAKIKQRRDGKEYLAVYYAGPIRGAGGTAAAFSVIIADYVRTVMGLYPYDPTEEEIERYVIEIQDYNDRVTNLQYFPSAEEIRFMIKHVPVEISGDPTEKIEVSNYKDQPRIETNLIRGGVCLVTAEGLTQKAPKLWKRLAKWGREFSLEWDFLEQFLELKAKIHASHTGKNTQKKSSDEQEEKLKPNNTFIADAVAGRPVLAFPMAPGGFRLRYGRNRVSGFSAASLHPATMAILDDFIAIGTQLKIERPGKGAAITPNDTIEGPIVRLDDGAVMKLNDYHQAKKLRKRVEKILYLGDILFNYGDFSENGHKLVPPGYCPEWWIQEVKKSYEEKQTLPSLISEEKWQWLLANPFTHIPSLEEAIALARTLEVPLHPSYTFFWTLINHDDFFFFYQWLAVAKKVIHEGKLIKVIGSYHERAKAILETLGVEHVLVNKEFIVLPNEQAGALLFSLGLGNNEQRDTRIQSWMQQEQPPSLLTMLKELSGVHHRDKAGTFIGARMGRPEKAKMRKLTGSPHTLFPVGEQGGRMRSFQTALEEGYVEGDFALFYCENCKEERLFHRCEICDQPTKPLWYLPEKKITTDKEPHEETKALRWKHKQINLVPLWKKALDQLQLSPIPDLVKGVRGTSNKDHIPEHFVKGILRAKWNIFVNKDGTTRYDMTELPLTHFKPKEIHTSLEKLKRLGYTHDIYGKPLEHEEQILEIKPQDIIIPYNKNLVDESAAEVMFRVGKFIDELLIKFYHLEPYYHFKTIDDLIGTLVIGLAPHISAGMIGRIIGFSQTQAVFAHPLWHAALRRDCDGDEACILLLMDGFLNFSRQYLPDKRGSRTMDSPLVLTTILNPTEVDDMAHGLDVVDHYPLAFYEAACQYKNPWDVNVEQLNKRLKTPLQYEGMFFTTDTSNINHGVLVSAYKTLPSMKEKLEAQMQLAKKIAAVDETTVADLVIQKHFLKDIMGNLKKFSQQQFRCVQCNEKYRRPPLSGKCEKCGGKIIFTISEGSIVKYLGPSLELAEVFEVSPYIKQTLELLKLRVESVFGKAKEKQEGLQQWFG